MLLLLVEHGPQTTLLHLQLCSVLPPPSSSSCTSIQLSTSPSSDLLFKCSSLAVVVCTHMVYKNAYLYAVLFYCTSRRCSVSSETSLFWLEAFTGQTHWFLYYYYAKKYQVCGSVPYLLLLLLLFQSYFFDYLLRCVLLLRSFDERRRSIPVNVTMSWIQSRCECAFNSFSELWSMQCVYSFIRRSSCVGVDSFVVATLSGKAGKPG